MVTSFALEILKHNLNSAEIVFFLNFYLFIFGRAGSLLLRTGFL